MIWNLSTLNHPLWEMTYSSRLIKTTRKHYTEICSFFNVTSLFLVQVLQVVVCIGSLLAVSLSCYNSAGEMRQCWMAKTHGSVFGNLPKRFYRIGIRNESFYFRIASPLLVRIASTTPG